MQAPRFELVSFYRNGSQTPLGWRPEQTSNPGVQPFSHRHLTQSVEVGVLQPSAAHCEALHATLSL